MDPLRVFDMSQYINGINKYSNNINSRNVFLQEIDEGNLPSVSYIFSQDANGYDMGAPSNILKGELWLIELTNSVEKSPIWNSTAIFITWDDPGGYYDQVPPPIIDGVQLGMRLPLIIVSPYAKENYIPNTLMSHSSILAFIDYNWEIPALNQFVSALPIPLDMFDFNMPRLPYEFTNFPLPDSLVFNLSESDLNFNYSAQFPVTPQLSFKNLPYREQGYNSITLADLNAGIYVKHDYSITPFFYTPYIPGLIVVLDAIVLYVLLWRHKNAKKE